MQRKHRSSLLELYAHNRDGFSLFYPTSSGSNIITSTEYCQIFQHVSGSQKGLTRTQQDSGLVLRKVSSSPESPILSTYSQAICISNILKSTLVPQKSQSGFLEYTSLAGVILAQWYLFGSGDLPGFLLIQHLTNLTQILFKHYHPLTRQKC